MRLFVAIDLSAETRTLVGEIQARLEAQLLLARRAPRITWVKPEAAHVTLQFLGETSDSQVERLTGALGSPRLANEPFAVLWGALGTFPETRQPRVVWLGAATGAKELSTLAGNVRERLAVIGVERDARPFRSHITIGRVRDPGIVNWPGVLKRVLFAPSASRVDHVTLYRSQLSPRGPTYTAVANFTL
jgi:2'-5' RNA ligase